MVSFDVASLFTNIPLKESIDFAISYTIEGNNKLKFSKVELFKMFSIATSPTHFLFSNNVFDKIDGVVVGSPPAYVDATFCVFYTEKEAKSFFDF